MNTHQVQYRQHERPEDVIQQVRYREILMHEDE
jgi:hypothetical protein